MCSERNVFLVGQHMNRKNSNPQRCVLTVLANTVFEECVELVCSKHCVKHSHQKHYVQHSVSANNLTHQHTKNCSMTVQRRK